MSDTEYTVKYNPSPNTNAAANASISVAPERKKTYSSFQEIDWLHEYQQQRFAAQKLDRLPTSLIAANIQKTLFHSEKWLVLILAALATGSVVAFIDSAAIWVNDIRVGHCAANFFLSKNACCLDEAVEGQQCLKWHDWNATNNAIEYLWFFLVYIVSSIGLTFGAYCITSRWPYAAKSGISEIKAIVSGLVFNEFLTLETLIAKTFSLVLVVGAGIWVGKEGPLVHVSCCIMAVLCLIFPRRFSVGNEAMKRELLAAAVAAGIAVAFNAPIGGVLFIIEQGYSNLRIDNIMWKAFICATVAVVVLQSLHPFANGNMVLFTVSNNKDWQSVEIVPFMLLAVAGGAYGFAFSKLNLWFAKFRATHLTSARQQRLEIIAIATITPILVYPLVFGRLSLSVLITRLFRDCEDGSSGAGSVIGGLCQRSDSNNFPVKPLLLLIFTAIEGFILSAYTYGTLLPSGILMPSLAIGACCGRALGLIIDHLQLSHPHWRLFSNCAAFAETAGSSGTSSATLNASATAASDPVAAARCISTGAYGVVGAASFLAGITKMTVSVVVIMFELTGALTYVLPIMIAVLVAKLVNDSLVMKNIYELWLRFSGFCSLDHNVKDLRACPDIPAYTVIKNLQNMKNRDRCHVLYLEEKDNELELTVDGILNFLGSIEHEDDLANVIDNGNRLQSDQNGSAVIGFPVLRSKHRPNLVGWISRNELQVELARLAMIPNFNNQQKVTLRSTKLSLHGITVANSFASSVSDLNFEVSDDDDDDDYGDDDDEQQADLLNNSDNTNNNKKAANNVINNTNGDTDETQDSQNKLSLSHLIEPCNAVPVFKATLAIVTVVDLFYKLNYNMMLFTNHEGHFVGWISKYEVVRLVESGFQLGKW